MRWNPSVEMLLRGALLSRTSSLRVLRRDTDVLRMLVAAMRAYAPRLDSARPPSTFRHGFCAGARSTPKTWRSTASLLIGFDYDRKYVAETYKYNKRSALALWTDVDRQAIVAALGDLVEPFHVNMLPIVMEQHSSLPDKCKRYSAIINQCLHHCPDEIPYRRATLIPAPRSADPACTSSRQATLTAAALG
ncbi:hypothetical protein HK405_010642, partial [Cladochytrium tenue]